MRLTIPLQKILDIFNINLPEDPEMNLERDLVTLTDCYFLEIREREEEEEEEIGFGNHLNHQSPERVLVDANNKVITQDAINEIEWLILDAQDCANYREIQEATTYLIEEILKLFSDYTYEYSVLTDTGLYAGVSGLAKGITKIQINWPEEVITLDLEPDFVYILEDCIAGYGVFEVEEHPELTEEEAEEFIRGHLGWLSEYFEIYGCKKPKMELNLYGDFSNKEVDWEHLRSIEKTYDIKICSKFYRDKYMK